MIKGRNTQKLSSVSGHDVSAPYSKPTQASVGMQIAFGNPVVPDEKYIAASSSSVISTFGASEGQFAVRRS